MKKLFNWLFKKSEKPPHFIQDLEEVIMASSEDDEFYEPSKNKSLSNNRWANIRDEKPTGVVLAAIYTYDCGWVQQTAWWCKSDDCWYDAGGISCTKSHLDFTHWTSLDYSDMPPKPDWRLGNDD